MIVYALCMYFCCFLCRLFSDADVLVLDSPVNCCKMPAGRLMETTVIPERCVCRSGCVSVDVCAHMCDCCLSPHSSTHTHTHTHTHTPEQQEELGSSKLLIAFKSLFCSKFC